MDVQDLLAREEYLDLYLSTQDLQQLKPLILEQLKMHGQQSPAVAGPRDLVDNMLSLRELLFRYHHPHEPADLAGLNSFHLGPNVPGLNSSMGQRAALASLLGMDFKKSSWPPPTSSVLLRMAQRIILKERRNELPDGQRLSLKAGMDICAVPVESRYAKDDPNPSWVIDTGKPPDPMRPGSHHSRSWVLGACLEDMQRRLNYTSDSPSSDLHGSEDCSSDDAGQSSKALKNFRFDDSCAPEVAQDWYTALLSAQMTGDVDQAQELVIRGPHAAVPSRNLSAESLPASHEGSTAAAPAVSHPVSTEDVRRAEEAASALIAEIRLEQQACKSKKDKARAKKASKSKGSNMAASASKSKLSQGAAGGSSPERRKSGSSLTWLHGLLLESRT